MPNKTKKYIKSTFRQKDIGDKYEKTNAIASDQYLIRMRMAHITGEDTHWFQMMIATIFTAMVVIITRMATYERPMDQFYWSTDKEQLFDFFSYYKMTVILICAVLALIILLYRIFTQSLMIKRSFAYIPMLVYSVFVIFSYIFSDYKEFSLLGWNDRFEGTLPLLAYMIMLFFIINSVNSEKNVKWIVYPLAATSTLLGILGLTQALGHDFFQTEFGKKLITPNWFWNQVDSLNFIFKEREIYQTVYNINYVSFYLTLLIPLFGLLFIRSVMLGNQESNWRKIVLGALFTLLVFNLIGSASSGGILGMAVVVLIAVIVLNRRIIDWWKPVLILLAMVIIVAGTSYNRWMPELSHAIDGVLGYKSMQSNNSTSGNEDSVETVETEEKHKFDYMATSGNDIMLSYDGNKVTITTSPQNPTALVIKDENGKTINLKETEVSPVYMFDDKRFKEILVKPAEDDKGNHYLIIGTIDQEWPFRLTETGPLYRNGLGNLVALERIPSVGWENNPQFGNGRGYIWSRTIPMLSNTMIIGYGADTYCAYFPHNDYIGKYNSIVFSSNINIIVDKPHNMYLGGMVGTGVISMLALLVLWGVYIIQSFIIYRKNRFKDFLSFTGAGIFLGVCGFLVSGLVNDSSVSVMPMFYGLLGTGIAINMMLKSMPRLEV